MRHQHVDELAPPHPHQHKPGAVPVGATHGNLPVQAYGSSRVLDLQARAGNRAVTGLLQGRSIPVQRCGPSGCGGKEEQELQQGSPVNPDEYASLAQPVLQRSTSWGGGTVHEDHSLADLAINGTEAGITFPMLNGANFVGRAAARAALVRPTVRTAAVPAGGFEAEVDNIPANAGGFDEHVLNSGPWRINTTQATVATLFPAIAADCGGAGASRFRAYGDPSDAAMKAANRRHEDHHARDHEAAFNATVVPWDARLAAAKAAGTKFAGASAAAAEAALWTAMGGTPDQIADAYWDDVAARGAAFHGTGPGGPVGGPLRPGSRAGCTISWAYFTNPS